MSPVFRNLIKNNNNSLSEDSSPSEDNNNTNNKTPPENHQHSHHNHNSKNQMSPKLCSSTIDSAQDSRCPDSQDATGSNRTNLSTVESSIPESNASSAGGTQSYSSSIPPILPTEFPMKYMREVCRPHLTPYGAGLFRRKVDAVPSSSASGHGAGTQTGANKYTDIIAYVIHCPKHSRIAVHSEPRSGIKWLPFSPLFAEKSWSDCAILGSLIVLADDCDDQFQRLRLDPPICSVQLLEITRMQLPQTLNFLTRLIFYVRLKSDFTTSDSSECLFDCCVNTSTITWISLDDVARNAVAAIWGPELVQYARQVQQNFVTFTERIEEFSLDDVYLYAPRDPPRNAEETMLLSLDFSEKTIELLYHEFLEHCYPCFSLTIESFKHYMCKYGLSAADERLNSLFFAFNYKRSGYISFHELLMGLAALEPLACHHEVRIKFVFRYFDLGCKGVLDVRDFETLVACLATDLDAQRLAVKIDDLLRNSMGPVVMRDGRRVITFNAFITAIGSHRLRGTSTLVRARFPVFQQLTRAFIRTKKATTTDLREWQSLCEVLIPRTYPGVCRRCRGARYRLAAHSVTINGSSGYVTAPVRVTERSTSAVATDAHSRELVFNPASVSNQLLCAIREFNANKGTTRSPRGVMEGSRNCPKLFELVQRLHREAITLLERENGALNRCPDVSSPCIVIGDIHGNLEDLLTLEKVLWRMVPCFGPSYLFLGDYVDRGKWGVECALYLIALKLLDPSKVTLLRGNHEVRALQEKYSYKKECITKYGSDYGEKIWRLTNEIFDRLPVAATIDSSIFCVHGGLSPHAQTLTQIREIRPEAPDTFGSTGFTVRSNVSGPDSANKASTSPSPYIVLSNPEVQSQIAWDLLWSDPCHMQQYLDYIELHDVSNELAQEGYLPNAKRGAAFLFNERAAKTFLARNRLTHIIRAHEVPPFGFAHHFDDLCTTVFSCSHYCNNDNEAAVILISGGRIRPIRIDTHNNAPATDK